MFKRLIAFFVCLTFSCSNLQYVHAQAGPATGGDFSVNQLPVPGTMIGKSTPFAPLALKGLVVNIQKPLEFQFIVDTGRGPQDTASIKEEANQLVKYFLAGLTIPEGDLWVNLSPYEKDRMVPTALGRTDLGRDLLAQDYILKQLTASLIYPEKDLGKEFWKRVYTKAQQQFGTTNVPVNTFNKVWILPDQAQVFENVNAAYVTKSTLKVMLDEDYLAKQKHQATKASSISSQIIREIVIPEITKEVNTGKNFAPLRQIYQALILAKWYKETIQNGLLDALYTNKNKVSGVNLNDPTVKEQIYERYLKAYKKGAFDYIKEDPTPDGQVAPRKYFSGGFTAMGMKLTRDGAMSAVKSDGAMLGVRVGLERPKDAAMLTNLKQARELLPQDQIKVEEKLNGLILVSSAHMLPDGRILTTSKYEVELWKVNAQGEWVGEEIIKAPLEGPHISLAQMFPDGRILTVSEGYRLDRWTLDTKRKAELWKLNAQGKWVVESTIQGIRSWVTSVQLLPDGRILMSSLNGVVDLFKINTSGSWDIEQTLEVPNLKSAQMLPDGRILTVSFDAGDMRSNNGEVELWKANASGSWDIEQTLEVSDLKSAQMLPDGRILTAGEYEVNLWKVNVQGVWAKESTLWGHSYGIMSAQMLVDGIILTASKYKDGVAKLWRFVQGVWQIEATLEVSDLKSAQMLPDGRILTASDHATEIWRVFKPETTAGAKDQAMSTPTAKQTPDAAMLIPLSKEVLPPGGSTTVQIPLEQIRHFLIHQEGTSNSGSSFAISSHNKYLYWGAMLDMPLKTPERSIEGVEMTPLVDGKLKFKNNNSIPVGISTFKDAAMLSGRGNLERTRNDGKISDKDEARILVEKAWRAIINSPLVNKEFGSKEILAQPPQYWRYAVDQFNTLPFNERVGMAKDLMKEFSQKTGVSIEQILSRLQDKEMIGYFINTVKKISLIADFLNQDWQQRYISGIGQGINTMMILQPDAVRGDMVDRVIGIINRAGFHVELGPEMVLTTDMARKVVAGNLSNRKLTDDYMTEGPVRVLFIWGDVQHRIQDLINIRDEKILPALGVTNMQKVRRKIFIPNVGDQESTASFLLQTIREIRNNKIDYNPAYIIDGAYRPPLSSQEIDFLTAPFGSVKDFWESGWRQAHPDEVLFYIIRHQESVSNVAPQVNQARVNFSPPTIKGKLQRMEMAKFLRDVVFKKFFASDSERAYLTLEELWKIQGYTGPMPYDRRLEELNMMPRGAVAKELNLQVFDPKGLLDLYPHLFRNLNLASYPYFESEIKSFYKEVLSGVEKGETDAIGTHGASLRLQLMVMGGIGVEKIKSANDFFESQYGPYPNVGISLVSYDLVAHKWKLLVYGDNSYLPESLQQGSEGSLAAATKVLAGVQAVKRRLQYISNQKNPHPVFRDYYPRGKVSWTWNVLRATIEDISIRNNAFLTRYPDRELWQEFWSTPGDAAMSASADVDKWLLGAGFFSYPVPEKIKGLLARSLDFHVVTVNSVVHDEKPGWIESTITEGLDPKGFQEVLGSIDGMEQYLGALIKNGEWRRKDSGKRDYQDTEIILRRLIELADLKVLAGEYDFLHDSNPYYDGVAPGPNSDRRHDVSQEVRRKAWSALNGILSNDEFKRFLFYKGNSSSYVDQAMAAQQKKGIGSMIIDTMLGLMGGLMYMMVGDSMRDGLKATKIAEEHMLKSEFIPRKQTGAVVIGAEGIPVIWRLSPGLCRYFLNKAVGKLEEKYKVSFQGMSDYKLSLWDQTAFGLWSMGKPMRVSFARTQKGQGVYFVQDVQVSSFMSQTPLLAMAENVPDSAMIIHKIGEWAHRHQPWTLVILSSIPLGLSKIISIWREQRERRVEANEKNRLALQEDQARQNTPSHKDNGDKAMNGGIDLNQINVLRNGKTVNVQFDPARLAQLEQGGFEGFTPVIINITPISSPLPLLGIGPAKGKKAGLPEAPLPLESY